MVFMGTEVIWYPAPKNPLAGSEGPIYLTETLNATSEAALNLLLLI